MEMECFDTSARRVFGFVFHLVLTGLELSSSMGGLDLFKFICIPYPEIDSTKMLFGK